MRRGVLFLVVLFLMAGSHRSFGASSKRSTQFGLGAGIASPTPTSLSSISTYALTTQLEGTMFFGRFFGISILATATSSPRTGGTYWFGTNGGYQQTFIEPRIYLTILHVGFAAGLDLASNGGTIQGIPSYGPMAGIEIPLGRFSIGADARYIFKTGSNPSPLTLLAMLRFFL